MHVDPDGSVRFSGTSPFHSQRRSVLPFGRKGEPPWASIGERSVDDDPLLTFKLHSTSISVDKQAKLHR
jgi:hypothetical protein